MYRSIGGPIAIDVDVDVDRSIGGDGDGDGARGDPAQRGTRTTVSYATHFDLELETKRIT